MSDLFAVGTNKNEPFCVTLDVEQNIGILLNAINGEDSALDHKLSRMPDVERIVVDAMTWEHENFIQEMITLIKRHGRFAIKHNDLTFGVSTDWDQAKTAFENKEF